jgi:hypothetical protein
MKERAAGVKLGLSRKTGIAGRGGNMTRHAVPLALVLTLGLLTLSPGGSWAGDLPAPTGLVVLTVAGEIGAANRGPSDPVVDAFFTYHEKSFETAAEFDRAMLEGLGRHEIELSYETWPKAYRFAGPRLVDVLSAAGAEGRAITVTALDGYAEEISADDLAAHDWIVALDVDGRPLGIGQQGPLWIVYAVPGNATSEDDARWPWAVFYIEVH